MSLQVSTELAITIVPQYTKEVYIQLDTTPKVINTLQVQVYDTKNVARFGKELATSVYHCSDVFVAILLILFQSL